MVEVLNKVSSQAVEKATGRSWDEWITFLDEKGARNKTHKEIVELLGSGRYVESAWWRQTVTVGYEYARGSRVLGETADAGFEVGVQKTLPIVPRKAWQLVTSERGVRLWLGDVPEMHFQRGYEYKTAEGASGVIRSVKNGERIRLTWKPHGRTSPTTLQISLVPSGEKTSLRIHHEKLAGEEERAQMRDHWREVLERLEKLVPRS